MMVIVDEDEDKFDDDPHIMLRARDVRRLDRVELDEIPKNHDDDDDDNDEIQKDSDTIPEL